MASRTCLSLFALFGRCAAPWALGTLVASQAQAQSTSPALPAARAPGAPALFEPCRLAGFEHEALCGRVTRPLDPGLRQGTQIEVHFAVLPALARNKQPDPVLVFAGGPGQSAIDLAGSWQRLLARLSNRRDLVLIDQRGTGRSAPLMCAEAAPTAPFSASLSQAGQEERLRSCREALQRLPHGDLRHYTTLAAMPDVEAVRQALGAPRVNLVGASYGTRAALEYQRQFPHAVRRLVLDGVVPPDIVLPVASSRDNQAALDAVWAACEADGATQGCAKRHPALRAQWHALLAGLPREVVVAHPLTGAAERVTLTREIVLGLVRAPLYAPALAAGLPAAVSEAARGRYEPLFGLASAVQGSRRGQLAEGMHFSVLCAEDVPRMNASAASSLSGADFGEAFAQQYRRICAAWPRGDVLAAFYDVPAAPAAALLLSGGADPVTPPRHGERVAGQLGPKARHVVVPAAGHGVMALPCVRDVLYRFISAPDDAAALAVDAGCASTMPRPPSFVPPGFVPAALVSPGGAAVADGSSRSSRAAGRSRP